MKRLKISKTAAVMCEVIGGLFVLFLAAGFLVIELVFPFERPVPYALGLLLGCILSAAKVVMMEKSLNRSLDMESKTAQGYAGMMVGLRYLLTVVMLLPVFLFRDVFGLFGAIIGVLSLQISAYITGRLIKKYDFAE